MPVSSISDPSDPRLDDYCNVPDAELLRARGIFVAEGRLVVRRLLTASRFAARSVLVTDVAYRSLEDLLADSALPVFVVPPALLEDITGFNIHRGCLAIGLRDTAADWRTLVANAARVVLLERVGNADNVGAVFRNAAAFGAGAILLDSATTDPLYRKAIRTSMGAALTVPFARVDPWPDGVRALRDRGVAVIGLATDASLTIAEAARQLQGRGIAVLAGHEGEGLTAQALGCCDILARIPMTGAVDSLNVATAVGIALYELDRRAVSPDAP